MARLGLPNLSVLAALYPAQYAAISLEGPVGGGATGRAALLDILLAYALCNDLYRATGLTVRGGNLSTFENVRSLRNPVHEFTMFYQDNLWTNPQRIEAENERILEPLHELRRWSNWAHGETPTHRASLAAFQFSLFGELFIKTNQRDDGRPYHTTIDPRFVDDDHLDTNERGFVEWIRIDQPATWRDPDTGELVEVMRTEVWDREPRNGLALANWPARVRVWQYDRRMSDAIPLHRLGDSNLVEHRVYDARRTGADTLPVDWIPIAYAAFEVMDDGRGWSPVVPALEAIDEACRVTTAAHGALAAASRIMRMLHSDSMDQSGRPKPPPAVADGATVEAGGETWYTLPSGWKLSDSIPGFDFSGIHAFVTEQTEWVKQELPELQFYDAVRDMGDPSGRAIHYRLAPILRRPLRARANAEAAKILANQHALTLGALAGTWGDIGTYEAGEFNHRFQEQPILPRDPSEQIADVKVLADAGAGIAEAARVAGLTDAQADTLGRADVIPPER